MFKCCTKKQGLIEFYSALSSDKIVDSKDKKGPTLPPEFPLSTIVDDEEERPAHCKFRTLQTKHKQ